MKFDRAFELLIGHEGGYTTNRNDRGNWTGGKVGVGILKGTKFGIAANTYPNLDIKNLTVEQAKEIYLRDFWKKARCDELPHTVRFDVFDIAVNSGVKRAHILLQRALQVTDDGIVGVKTKAALSKYDPEQLLMRLAAERILFYSNLNDFKHFGKGWVRRVAANLQIYVKEVNKNG